MNEFEELVTDLMCTMGIDLSKKQMKAVFHVIDTNTDKSISSK